MSLRKAVLRFVSPRYEDERMDQRMHISIMRAHTENLKREIQAINGHAAEHPVLVGLQIKRPSRE